MALPSFEIELEVGINTYVNVQEADNYVYTHFFESSPEYRTWFHEEMQDSDKKRSLISSAVALNNLKYTGAKKVRGQALAFPRKKMVMPGYYMLPFTPQTYDYSLVNGGGGDDGLKSAKAAQIENAIMMITLGTSAVTQAKKRNLSGIKSKRADDISETFEINNSTADALTGLYAKEKVEKLLKAWLTKSVYTI